MKKWPFFGKGSQTGIYSLNIKEQNTTRKTYIQILGFHLWFFFLPLQQQCSLLRCELKPHEDTWWVINGIYHVQEVLIKHKLLEIQEVTILDGTSVFV